MPSLPLTASHHPSQEEFEIAYKIAKEAGMEPNMSSVSDGLDDPEKITVVRWIMENAHCGWLIGKGGSGIRDIEVRVIFRTFGRGGWHGRRAEDRRPSSVECASCL